MENPNTAANFPTSHMVSLPRKEVVLPELDPDVHPLMQQLSRSEREQTGVGFRVHDHRANFAREVQNLRFIEGDVDPLEAFDD